MQQSYYTAKILPIWGIVFRHDQFTTIHFQCHIPPNFNHSHCFSESIGHDNTNACYWSKQYSLQLKSMHVVLQHIYLYCFDQWLQNKIACLKKLNAISDIVSANKVQSRFFLPELSQRLFSISCKSLPCSDPLVVGPLSLDSWLQTENKNKKKQGRKKDQKKGNRSFLR